jgi:hypothetical protein
MVKPAEDRREPAIELGEEPAVVVRERSPALQLASEDAQLISQPSISASSRLFDPNGEASRVKMQEINMIIAPT